MSTTTDLSKFGFREWDIARHLLDAMIDQGLPEGFENDGVHLMFNMNSGHVFFTNSEHQVAMLNGDKLESFYSCPVCGHEGFKDELEHNELNGECQEWLADIEKVAA